MSKQFLAIFDIQYRYNIEKLSYFCACLSIWCLRPSKQSIDALPGQLKPILPLIKTSLLSQLKPNRKLPFFSALYVHSHYLVPFTYRVDNYYEFSHKDMSSKVKKIFKRNKTGTATMPSTTGHIQLCQ